MKKSPIAAALTCSMMLPALAANAQSDLKANAVTNDKTPPTVTAFSVPALSSSLQLAINSFVASDDQALAGYLITSTSTKPAASATGWSATRPNRYTATAPGTLTLYAWTKDQAGNVSAPATAQVNIDTTAPTISAFRIPAQSSGLDISIVTLSATDNRAVTGYAITADARAPGAKGPGWTTSAPTRYTASKTGSITLYAWAKDEAGNVSQSQSATSQVSGSTTPGFNMDQTLSDQAQRTTLAFAGLAMLTGNLQAQTFFPPGKVADYTGFQYLRDNDPDGMGHNTSFLTRVANNVLYVLDDAQFEQLKTLAVNQLEQINDYGYQRYPLMQAFRRQLNNELPAYSSGLNLNAVKQASKALYLIDGQISFDRAVLYANIISSLTPTQRSYLAAMKGKGWKSWPDISNDQVSGKMRGLPQGTAVAVMTYASDLFSWYAGSVEADVYFCPERHGTYFGSFYIKDAPAIGHEGYAINEQLTATAGAALSDSSKGYVTPTQASLMSNLVDTQRSNLYSAPETNIVKLRTQIATLLRSLLTSTATATQVQAQVLELSGLYGELDGANNYAYASAFTALNQTLSTEQKTKLTDLRHSIMSGTYADGTPFDYSVSSNYFLYSEILRDLTQVTPYMNDSDALFFEP